MGRVVPTLVAITSGKGCTNVGCYNLWEGLWTFADACSRFLRKNALLQRQHVVNMGQCNKELRPK